MEEFYMSTVHLVMSGKGGVGKSTFSAGLGIALADLGMRVCILDTDIGLRGQDTLLGLQDNVIYDSLDVIQGNCELEDALLSYRGQDKLFLLCAPQFSRVRDFSPRSMARLVKQLRRSFGHVIIDAPAGIEKGLRLSLRSEIDDTCVVVTPDDLCIRDAERVISLLEERELPRPRLIVNRLIPGLIEKGEMYSAQTVAQTLDCELLGAMPDDPTVYRAQLQHLNFMQFDCEARDAMLRIARRVCGEYVEIYPYGKKRSWLARMLRPGSKEVVRIDC